MKQVRQELKQPKNPEPRFKYMLVMGNGNKEMAHHSTEATNEELEETYNRCLETHEWCMVFETEVYYELWKGKGLQEGEVVEKNKKLYL